MSQQAIAKPLVHIFHLFFSTGVFPDLLKIANIIDLRLQQLSLISNLGKLIEKIVHKRLYNFIEKHTLLF